MDKLEYSKYLNHPLWEKQRQYALKYYGSKCSECGSSKNLQVHHKTYSKGKMPWEYPIENFLILCESCHKLHHGYEYTPNKCQNCGKEISDKFKLCINCHNNIINEKENEKKVLENKIFALESEITLQETQKPQNVIKEYNLKKINRLTLERDNLLAEKDKVMKKLAEVKSIEIIEADTKRIEAETKKIDADTKKIKSQVSSLKKVTIISIITMVSLIIFFIIKVEQKNQVIPSSKNILNHESKEATKQENIFLKENTNNYLPKDNRVIEKQKNTVEIDKKDKNIASNLEGYKPINLTQVLSNIGNKVSLMERITQVNISDDGNIYMNIGGKFPFQKLSLVVFKDKTFKFKNPKQYENMLVKIKGTLTTYKNTPQIIINEVWQIVIQ